MSEFEVIPYIRLVRDEDWRKSGLAKRDIENALRWWPPCRDDEGADGKGNAYGYRALKQLADGDTVSPIQVAAAKQYIEEAIAYYQSNPFGDSQMRDIEPIAVEEFNIVKEMLA